jgi:hypothetical protein
LRTGMVAQVGPEQGTVQIRLPYSAV